MPPQSTWWSISNCCSFLCRRNPRGSLYEPLLENEREAVQDLLRYLENRDDINFFVEGDALRALSLMAYSDHIDLQRSAAMAFVDLTEKNVQPASREAIECAIYLLQSGDSEVQRCSAASLGNLAAHSDNQVLIVECGALEPLVQLMQSGNPEVQCNAVGCITNLATHADNKERIARSGALVPLTRLARSKDMRVQRNATGAILNMTNSVENRQQLVTAGALPVLVQLLQSPDFDVQYYCTTALSNIAVDELNRTRLATSEPHLIPSLITLLQSLSLKVQCQAALCLRNLASDPKFQIDIVLHDGLPPLLTLLKSRVPQIVLAAAACLRNLSISPANETPLVEGGFLEVLVELISYDNEEIQSHALSTIRNVCSQERNMAVVVSVGTVEKIGGLLRMEEVPENVKCEMMACLALLVFSEEARPRVAKLVKVLARLMKPEAGGLELRSNAGAVVGNLAARLEGKGGVVEDVFKKEWDGVREGLIGFLREADGPDGEGGVVRQIGVWTLSQIVQGSDALKNKVVADEELVALIRTLAATGNPPASVDAYETSGPATLEREDANGDGSVTTGSGDRSGTTDADQQQQQQQHETVGELSTLCQNLLAELQVDGYGPAGPAA